MPALKTKEKDIYGTRETLCRLLGELYLAETPLNLIIWPPVDTEALADGVEYTVLEQDTRAVLTRMGVIPEEQWLESGASAGTVMDLTGQVKGVASGVVVPVELSETLPITAERALWHRGWTARGENHPMPENITRRPTGTAKVRALLKK